MNREIQFQNWGLIEYNQAWKKQEEIFNQQIALKSNELHTANHLILCQHPHVYTMGKSGDDQNLLLNYIQLQAKNASFVKTNRGGDITYHGPGQIVGYPIFDLSNFNLGLKQYIWLLEEAIIRTLAYYKIASQRLEGATGVWLDVGKPQCRKICAIGVRSSKYITMHGFALNVNTQLEYFQYINPCGFVDKGVSSMAKELNQIIDIQDVECRLQDAILRLFRVHISNH
jgi:lipoyl(octanoyl) transferase